MRRVEGLAQIARLRVACDKLVGPMKAKADGPRWRLVKARKSATGSVGTGNRKERGAKVSAQD